MQTEPNSKQQIVERIKNSTNILVTVGSNPSVDALSAALSLTLMLNRLDKHATAVFSGEVPQALNFLEPTKTFENSVDSLRDFIIALDKEKADRLRYKVEDDVVRIFITPYRTVLSDKDLKFSQGDFNVELIIALGVERREDLDTAITAHGRILHDATVVTINNDGGQSTLGALDWSDTSASSLCEMLMSLSEALQSGLLDQQIATAVLTGIVAATDRFRNEHTSPRVMTMAAQLMAAGANQQLIAAKLEEGQVVPMQDGSTRMSEGKSQKVAPKKNTPKKKNDGSLEIKHTPQPDAPKPADPAAEALSEAEKELESNLQGVAPAAAPTLSVADLKNDLAEAAKQVDDAAATEVRDQQQPAKLDAASVPAPQPAPAQPFPQPSESQQPDQTAPAANNQAEPKIIKRGRRSWKNDPGDKPAFGGTLNATAGDAEEAKREEELASLGQQMLQHDSAPAVPAEPVAPQPAQDKVPVSAPASQSDFALPPLPPLPTYDVPPQEMDTVPTQPQRLESTADEALSFELAPVTPVAPSLQDIDDNTRGKAAEDARAAIDAALSAMPFDPAGKPLEGSGAAPVFTISHESQTQPSVPVSPQTAQPVSAPALPPLPDFSTLPPLPGEEPLPQAPQPFVQPQPLPSQPAPSVPPAAPLPADPGQFKIPGQP